MGKLIKLLDKPLRTFTLYALLILAGSIPVYYAVVDYIWLKELDEHNTIVKEKIKESLATADIPAEEMALLLQHWNTILPGTSILASHQLKGRPDSIYTIDRLNRHQEKEEMDRFRGLSAIIAIDGKNYKLQIETNVEEASETFAAISIVTLSMFSLLAIGFILLNRRLSKNVWKPFHATLQKLSAFDLGKPNAIHFAPTNIEEFDVLNGSLQKLLDNNIATYKQQQTFIENAAHELQTPLAVLQSKLELLLQQDSATKATTDIIAAIELPLQRMSRINKNLLLLARIDNHQFPETENVDLAFIVGETLEMLDDYIDSKEIRLQQSLSTLVVKANKTLIEILVSNLVINAVTHNYRQGAIDIHLSGQTLTVSNSGKKELHSTRVFERFAIASTETASSGLGLSIVKEICQRYHWRLGYRFSHDKHQFSIGF